jgi:hypothetical protein
LGLMSTPFACLLNATKVPFLDFEDFEGFQHVARNDNLAPLANAAYPLSGCWDCLAATFQTI